MFRLKDSTHPTLFFEKLSITSCIKDYELATMANEVIEMSDNKPKETQEQAPKTNQGAGGAKSSIPKADAVVQASGWKRWLGKKWVFPATYMAAAAIILALMWVLQDSGSKDLNTDLTLDPNDQNEIVLDTEEALPVGAVLEEMQWPVNRSEVEVIMPFFEASASNEEKQAAILVQGNKFIPNMGVSLSRSDNKTFDIQAALSGEVTRSEKVPSVGNLVEIKHDDGLATIYYSLADVKVAKGDTVKQGDVIAKAGRNEIEKDLGVHLHFEVHKGGEPVNPSSFIQKTGSSTSEDKSTQKNEPDQTRAAD